MVVYDLGGGTFDVSIVVVEDGVVEVKASHGDTRLGGDDFDDLLVKHALEQLAQTAGQDVKSDLRTQRRLKYVMEHAKWTLSDSPFAKVQEEYVLWRLPPSD